MALALVLSTGLGACARVQQAACPDLKVGVLFTSEDDLAKSELEAGYQEALKEINAKGIAGGCKVELVYPQSQKTAADEVARDVQDLVDQGALVILSAQTSGASKRIARVSRYLNIPVIIAVETGDEILETTENPWFVRINPANADYPATVFKFLALSGMASAPRIAIVFEQSEFGESGAADVGQLALENEVPIGLFYRFSPFLTDFEEVSTLLARTDPPVNVVYLISSNPAQARQLLDEVSNVRTTLGATLAFEYIFGAGPAFTSREFFNDGANIPASLPSNLVLAAPWAPDYKWGGLAQCAQASLPASGVLGSIANPSMRSVQGYASLRLAVSGIEQGTKKSGWKINDQLTVNDWKEMVRNPEYLALFRAELTQFYRNTRTCQLGTQLWPVSFNAYGQNQRQPLLVQIKDGKFETVFPKP